MKKYRCPSCHLTSKVIRQTKRGKSILYKCKECVKYFSIKTVHIDTKVILLDHLNGISFRRLAEKYNISKSHASDLCYEELLKLPDSNKFTYQYCNRFSRILVVDGKYFTLKGFLGGYVLLWGVDYFRHDIPVFTLAPSENYHAWATYFSYYRILNTQPQLVVCDDNTNLKLAARNLFPAVKIQTCYNHFKEVIRRNLKVRSDRTYKPFMNRIEDILSEKLSDEAINKKLFTLYTDYRHDPICLSVLTSIQKYQPELLGYRGIPDAPLTSNLIESFNSHLEARLFSLQHFNSLKHAKLWLNGYILKRRMTKFHSCKGKFRYLNGKTGVEMTKKQEIAIPTYF